MLKLLPNINNILVPFLFFSHISTGIGGAGVPDIDKTTLKSQLQQDKQLVLVDVRTPVEVELAGGEIDANRHFNIPRGWLEFRIRDRVPDFDTPIVVYCGTNQRSPLAAQTLLDMGYTNVKSFSYGFSQWHSDGEAVSGDIATRSILYSKPQQVTDSVWSAIGATAPPSYHNSGHNNNLSFIVSDAGVLVVNAGDNYLLAQSLHNEIKQITDQPVKYVVLENGQGHAMLGMNYWQEQGATVISHVDTVTEIEMHGQDSLDRMITGRADKSAYTRLSLPDESFTDKRTIQLGELEIQLLNLGPSHSPGDIVVWLPSEKVAIAGDIAFHERLLPIFEHTNTQLWIETWDKFEALKAEKIIPGHGHPVEGYEIITKYTRDYLVDLREKIAVVIDDGGDLQDAYNVDQSAYAHLDTYFELVRRNADQVFREMEFDF